LIPIEVLQWVPALVTEVGQLVVANVQSLVVGTISGLIGNVIWARLRKASTPSPSEELVRQRTAVLDADVPHLDTYAVEDMQSQARERDRKHELATIAAELGVDASVVEAAVTSVEATARTVSLISISGGGSISAPRSSASARE